MLPARIWVLTLVRPGFGAFRSAEGRIQPY